MARFPNTISKEDRLEAHTAKMAGKIIDRARLYDQLGQRRMTRALLKNYGTTSIAGANRHTGKPHENKRAIARRLRQDGLANVGGPKVQPALAIAA